jgi:hypothetical protein
MVKIFQEGRVERVTGQLTMWNTDVCMNELKTVSRSQNWRNSGPGNTINPMDALS